MEPVLEMKGIYKRFTGVQALKDVNLKLYAGEIHSLIGQNGAGKSTLMKILSGNYKPDQGQIFISGKPVEINSQADAARHGIAIVYQELSLLNNLTVSENIFLGREAVKGLSLDNRAMRAETLRILEELGIKNIDVDQKLEVFPLAKKQLIEIAKAISMKPSILILDEPTAALTNEDTVRLFNTLFKLKDQGIALVFISHRLGEIKKYCDRGTVLMNGSVTANVQMKDVTELEIIESMLGDTYKSFQRTEKTDVDRRAPFLTGRNISLKDALTDVSFEIYAGEITGFTGLLGAGQDVLWRIVYGQVAADSGEICVKGRNCRINQPIKAVKQGIGLLTENRKEEGLFENMSVLDNISIPSLKAYRLAKGFPYLRVKKVKADCMDIAKTVNIVMRNIFTPIKFLSGGNQQKAILSRWLLKSLDLLVFIEPTRGVDVGAKSEIYRLLENLAKKGKAIVVVSTDTTEILGLSDRIFVMKDGRIRGVLETTPKEEELLRMVQGKEASV